MDVALGIDLGQSSVGVTAISLDDDLANAAGVGGGRDASAAAFVRYRAASSSLRDFAHGATN
jgi:hypothetical protein